MREDNHLLAMTCELKRYTGYLSTPDNRKCEKCTHVLTSGGIRYIRISAKVVPDSEEE